MHKILLAEDDNDMRRFLVKALENAGFQVSPHDNGMSAYQRLREEPFEMLLTDIVMPEMDGITATRTIRAKGGRLAELPIIALTANAFPDDIKQCREAGMSDFLAKPLRKPAMVAAMLKALGPAAPTVAAPSLAPSEDGASVAAEA